MKTRRVVLVMLLAATAIPPLASAQDAGAEYATAASTVDAAVIALRDHWNAPAGASFQPPAFVGAARAASADAPSFDAQPRHPALTFADQHPLRPNLFDSATAWEDEP